MKRIAILGCENSHADAFLSCIRDRQEFSNIEVVGVYSNEPEQVQRIHDTFGVPVMEHYADAVGQIDGLVITARHGENHYKYAKPYIDSGIPMFIDKPITIREDEAVLLMKTLKEKEIPICGGSSLKQAAYVAQLKADAENAVDGKTVGGYVRAPYERENIYGGFYFYAQHLVETVCEIFGRYPISVTARENGSTIHVLFHYEAFDCVGLFVDTSYVYYAARMAEVGCQGGVIPIDGDDWFYREFKEFCDLLDQKKQCISYEDFISPVCIMNAIERALLSGKEETVNKYKI